MTNVRRHAGRLLLIVVAAGFGFVLFAAPSHLAAQYERIRDWGRPWVIGYFSLVGAGALLLGGSAVWTIWTVARNSRKKQVERERRARDPRELTADELQQETADNLSVVAELQADPEVDASIKAHLERLKRRVEEKQEARRLEIVAFGAISSGKSSLLNALAGRDVFATDPRGGTTVNRNEVPWPGEDRVVLVDTPGLGEVEGYDRVAIAAAAAQDADLVLLVVDGPLRDAEFRLLDHLGRMGKRVVVCVNKLDWYAPSDRAALVSQLAGQLQSIVTPDDIVWVQAQPTKRRRVRILSDGSEQEETVESPPDIRALADRMLALVRRDGHDLLLANLLLQSRGLVAESKRQVKAALEGRARELVDRYAWGAGAAAALSPLPVLDLVAGGALTTKMVLDLARIYRQDMDAAAVVALLGQLGKNLIAILGVSAATPVVASTVASLMKAIPGVGTLAGGTLQGVVQALVTRWIGAVFIVYFEREMQAPPGGLAELARLEWQRLTTVASLRDFIQTARRRLAGAESDADREFASDAAARSSPASRSSSESAP